MQFAKDSFYRELRARLTALNPERVALIRGCVRPGILVEEAEGFFSQVPNDIFVLRWPGTSAEPMPPSTLIAAECEIGYQTVGTPAFGGLDRGRKLSEMDSELLAILAPFQTQKIDYSTTPPTEMLTRIFWEEPVFGPLIAQGDRLCRTVKVRIYSYQEEGE